MILILIILFWGLAPILIKKGLSYLSPWQSYLIDTLVALALWIPYGLIVGINLSSLNLVALLMLTFLGFTFIGYYYLINKGPVSLIIPIFSASPIVTVTLSILFLHENLNPIKLIAIILTIVGVLLVSITKNVYSKKVLVWVVPAILLTVCWGLEGVFVKYLVTHAGKGTFIAAAAVSQVFALFVWYLFSPSKRIFPSLPKKYFLPTILSVILYNAGYILLSKAMENNLASIVIPLTNTSVAVTVVFSYFFLKEKITFRQIAGICLIVIGVILVNF